MNSSSFYLNSKHNQTFQLSSYTPSHIRPASNYLPQNKYHLNSNDLQYQFQSSGKTKSTYRNTLPSSLNANFITSPHTSRSCYNQSQIDQLDKNQLKNKKFKDSSYLQITKQAKYKCSSPQKISKKEQLNNEKLNKIIQKYDKKQKLLKQLKQLSQLKISDIRKKVNGDSKLFTQSEYIKDMGLSSLKININEVNKIQQNILPQFKNNKNDKYKYQRSMLPKYFTPKYQKKNPEESLQNSQLIDFNMSKTPNMQKSKINIKNSIIFQVSSPKKEQKSNKLLQVRKFLQGKTKTTTNNINIASFKIIKTLGQGKFGSVSAAIHKQSGFLVALKKIKKQMIKNNLMIDQLILQIKIQSICQHKNIAKIYSWFEDTQNLYLMLQFMQEGTLYHQLKKKKILNQKQTALVIKQITSAVSYLHQNGIAHRDIKPENIIISNNTFKLCDFGWATICNERRKTYCGTFDYAAPQIIQGNQYDASVDLWCLGVLAYELLVGKAPFYHMSRKQTIKNIVNVDSTLSFPSYLSQDSISFIQNLLKKKPSQRMKAQDILFHPFLKNIQE